MAFCMAMSLLHTKTAVATEQWSPIASFFAWVRGSIYGYAISGNADRVRDLLAEGTDVDSLSSKDFTALYLAASRGHIEVVEVLLEAGADPNLPVGENNNTPLHASASQGHTEVMLRLIERGADVDAQTGGHEFTWGMSRNTPLHLAVLSRQIDSIQVLLEAGADSTITNSRGATPFLLFISNAGSGQSSPTFSDFIRNMENARILQVFSAADAIH